MNKTNLHRLLNTLLSFMIMLLTQRGLSMAAQALGWQGDWVQTLAFVAGCAVGMAAFFAGKPKKEEENRDEIEPLGKRKRYMSLLQMVVACGAMVAVMYMVSAWLGGGAETPNITLVGALSTLLLHPILEEYVFRKLFYGELRLLHPVFGCVAQALMFAIAHDTVEGMFYALLAGLVLGVLYEKSGRLSAVIGAHMLVNLRSYLYLTVLKDMGYLTRLVDMALMTATMVLFVVCMILDGKGIAAPQIEAKKSRKRAEGENGYGPDGK